MSSTLADFAGGPGDKDSTWRRVGRWAGHYYLYVAGVLMLVSDLYNLVFNPRDNLSATGLIGWLMTGALMGAIYASARHDRRLCEACIRDMPLNGEERAAKEIWYLRTAHGRNLRKIFVRCVLPYLALAMFCRFGIDLKYPWSNLVGEGVTVLLLLMNVVVAKHRRLQPWCPFCHWNDGGSGAAEPSPDPDPSAKVPV
jgi:hypothetical protein